MKGLQVTKNVRSDEKGTKGLQRCYEISYEATIMVRSYEKGMKLRKRYERVTKRSQNYLPSYEKGTKRYEATKKVRSGYEISYERYWLRSSKLRDSDATYRDNFL